MAYVSDALEWGWFAERWHWPPSVTLEQPLHFVAYAPATYAAKDKLQQEHEEREQRKQQSRETAAQRSGPKYGGGR